MNQHMNEILEMTRVHMCRIAYRTSWQRLRETDHYGHGPAGCHIHNGQPQFTGGASAFNTNALPSCNPSVKRINQGGDSGDVRTARPERSSEQSKKEGESNGDGDGEPARPPVHQQHNTHLNSTPSFGSIFPDIALWRLSQVLEHIPVSKSTWWAGVKSGRYPQGVKISSKCTAWRVKDILTLAQSLYSKHNGIVMHAPQFKATKEACK
jgi:predicted DNA-binding transcriptional regulator AlpA